MQLIKNEQNKIYRLKSTWAMYIILFLLVIAGAIITKVAFDDIHLPSYSENWEQELTESNERMQQENQSWSEDDASGWEYMIEYNEEQIAINEYYLENQIEPPSYDGWSYLFDNSMLSSIISLFTIIIGAGIIANEYKWGTIKLLLIRPVSRTKILLSKYVSVLIFALSALVFMMIGSLLVGAIFFGLNGMNPTLVMNSADGLVETSYLIEFLKEFGFSSVNLIMMATFAFMISTIFRSSSFSIGIAIFLMLSGNTIVQFVSQYDWAKYILFANTDLSRYFNGIGPLMDGMTLGFSITVLIVYYLVFIGLAWISFTKRDVAGN